MYSDVFGQALLDYYLGEPIHKLLLHNSYGDPEEMPVEVFYRSYQEMSELDQFALSKCHGCVLDVGAGVGAHSLLLQNEGVQVTALEYSKIAVQIMKQRGVQNVVNEDIFIWKGSQFDTLLLLMNGVGLVETKRNLYGGLTKLKSFLKPGGQIILDSSDISYLYDHPDLEDQHFGDVTYQYEYKGTKGEKFNWTYIDKGYLVKIAKLAGFRTQIIHENNEDQYLAVLKV